MKAIKILLLFVLAIVAIPVGIVYSVGESLYFITSDILRSIWRAIYDLFRDVSIIVSVTASKFLNRLLMDSGVPFGHIVPSDTTIRTQEYMVENGWFPEDPEL